MTSFPHLPQEIYLSLREYFISLSIEPYKQQGFQSWRNFLNCNKKIFGDAKRYCVLYNLKPPHSVLYLSHSSGVSSDRSHSYEVSSLLFIQHLQKQCLNPGLQIMLYLPFGHCGIEDTTSAFDQYFSILQRKSTTERKYSSLSVYGFTFTGYKTLTSLSSYMSFLSSTITFLDLSNCTSLVDISCLSLFFSCKIIKLAFCKSIRDFSSLSNCAEVDLSYTMIEDLTCLMKNAKKVNLTACPKIIDVSPLTNAIDVNLSMCQEVTNISSLKNVKKLILVSCRGIQDVSMLGKVQSLDLSLCRKNLDISCLKNIPNFLYFQLPY
jgi:hypothetical protein